MRHSCQKIWEGTAKNGQKGNKSQGSSSSFKNSAKCTLMVQSPMTRVKCQARCNHHPWRQCSLYIINLQLAMQVEAVTHGHRWTASRHNSQTTRAIIFTDSLSLLPKVKSEMGCPDSGHGCTAWKCCSEGKWLRRWTTGQMVCIAEDLFSEFDWRNLRTGVKPSMSRSPIHVVTMLEHA